MRDVLELIVAGQQTKRQVQTGHRADPLTGVQAAVDPDDRLFFTGSSI